MEYDCQGEVICGANDHEIWMGTKHAWIILGDSDASGCDDRGIPDGSQDGPDVPLGRPVYYAVVGKMGFLSFRGYWVASSERRVRQYLGGIGVEDLVFENTVQLPQDLELSYELGYQGVDEAERRVLLRG